MRRREKVIRRGNNEESIIMSHIRRSLREKVIRRGNNEKSTTMSPT
jgi:hypothetical protein